MSRFDDEDLNINDSEDSEKIFMEAAGVKEKTVIPPLLYGLTDIILEFAQELNDTAAETSDF